MDVTLRNSVNAIRDQLENKIGVYTADVAMLNEIVRSFHEVWKLSRKYPILNTFISSDIFYEIYTSMSEYFDSAASYATPSYQSVDMDPEIKYICDACDNEIELLNRDLEFSFQMHSQSFKHCEVMKDFCEGLKYLDIATADERAEFYPDFLNSRQGVFSNVRGNDKDLPVLKETKRCVHSCFAFGDEQTEATKSTSAEGKSVSCKMGIDQTTRSPTDTVVSNRGDPYLDFSNYFVDSAEEPDKFCEKRANLSLLETSPNNGQKKNRGFTLSKNAGLIKFRENNFCFLCNVMMCSTSQMDNHKDEPYHNSLIREKVEKIHGKFGTKFLVAGNNLKEIADNISNGIEMQEEILYCNLCDVKMPSQSQLESHLNGINHISIVEN